VVIHDPNVERTTNGRGDVKELTLSELKQLDAGDLEQIPTLLEVMELCRGRIDLQIDLKDPNSPIPVAELIRSHWEPASSVITSFDLALISEFGRLMPLVPRGLLNRKANLDMVVVAQEHGHRWICPRSDIVVQELVQKAHAAALRVYVYHVNDRKLAQKLTSWRVDAIGTDDPAMLSELLSTTQAQLKSKSYPVTPQT
jgi:glycerophosphoryl diester phosphodiesterase